MSRVSGVGFFRLRTTITSLVEREKKSESERVDAGSCKGRGNRGEIWLVMSMRAPVMNSLCSHFGHKPISFVDNG